MFPRKHLCRPRLGALFGAALALASAGQASPSLAQSAPATLQDVRKAWAAAVQRSNAPAAAALAVLPLQFVGYRHPKTLSRAGYLSQIEHWASLKGCLASEPIKPDRSQRRLGTHSFNCDGHGFFFAQKDGVWRHTGYENSNE